VLGYLVTTLAFAMIYKIMPRVKIRWHDVWLGAAVTALLFTVGRFLIGLYVGKSGVASGFGAAGSLIIILLWVYYSAQIFLLGAEFTWVYARKYGSMRNLDAPPKLADEDARPIPLRSEHDGRTHLSAPIPISAPAPEPANARPLWVNVGAGAAFLLMLNYVASWFLKRD